MTKLDKETIDRLWNQGFRPYEVYVYNKDAVDYGTERCEAGSIPGWDIEHVFAKRDDLEAMPFFDVLIGTSDMSRVEYMWAKM